MKFTQNYAIPSLLFRAISTLNLSSQFDPALLISFYTGASLGFTAGLLGARFNFMRSWSGAVAISFVCLFSNSVLLGLPITERAYGMDALAANYVIVAIHAPFCYMLGVTAMEIERAESRKPAWLARKILRSMFRNALVIGIVLGLVVNLSGLPLPGVFTDAVDMMVVAALPAALFGLGGVLVRYRPEGDSKMIAMVCVISLVLHSAISLTLATLFQLDRDALRSAVLTASMAPGINTTSLPISTAARAVSRQHPSSSERPPPSSQSGSGFSSCLKGFVYTS